MLDKSILWQYNVLNKQKERGENLSEREKEIIEKFKATIPEMTEFEQGYLLGKAEGLVEAKKNKELKTEQPQSVKNWRSERKEETVTTGELIKKYRKEKKLKKKQLAEKAGIGQTSLAQYEIGRRNAPLRILKKLSDALEIPINYLIEDMEMIPKKLEEYSTEELLAEIIRRANDHGGIDSEV